MTDKYNDMVRELIVSIAIRHNTLMVPLCDLNKALDAIQQHRIGGLIHKLRYCDESYAGGCVYITFRDDKSYNFMMGYMA